MLWNHKTKSKLPKKEIDKEFHGRIYKIGDEAITNPTPKDVQKALKEVIGIFKFPSTRVDSKTLKNKDLQEQLLSDLYYTAYGYGESFGARVFIDYDTIPQTFYQQKVTKNGITIATSFKYDTVPEETARERLIKYLHMDIQELAELAISTINAESQKVLKLADEYYQQT